MNENWEADEFKALEVFCNMNNFGHEVFLSIRQVPFPVPNPPFASPDFLGR